MQRTFLMVLLSCSSLSALADGTVAFSNGGVTRIQVTDLWSAPPTTNYVPTTPGLINYGLFYGTGQSTSLTFLSGTIGVNSTSSAGIIAGAADGKTRIPWVELPGTYQGEDDVWLQVKGWDARFGTDWQAAMSYGAYFGQTDIRNIGPMGPAITGPGVPIWQVPTSTDPHMFYSFTIFVIPEPSTFALVGLGAAAYVMLRRRR